LIGDRKRFRSTFETKQHPPRHEKRRWFNHAHEQPRAEGDWDANAVPRHDARPVLVEWVQAKLPDPLEPLTITA